ncbi:hypothetical protein AHF37_06626 [Paragonimus kellicotti]|nr:hypothetical protein AHF37_06626 [Paragonimus kellicotti]
MSASRLVAETNQFGAQEQSVSSLGLPISVDPFSGMDPFNPDASSKPIKDDPFGTTNLFSTSDPFKGLDPFGADPFASTADKSGEPPSDIVISGTVFVLSSVPSDNQCLMLGHFPLNSVSRSLSLQLQSSKYDVPSAQHYQIHDSANNAGGPTQLSIGDAPTLTSTTLQTLGSLPDFSASLAGSKFRPTGNSISPVNVHKSSMFSRSKGGGDLLAGRNNHAMHRTSLNKGDKMTTWAPSGLSEEEQLSIATRESQRLARMEERARRQEEADLELALQLSKMDAALS